MATRTKPAPVETAEAAEAAADTGADVATGEIIDDTEVTSQDVTGDEVTSQDVPGHDTPDDVVDAEVIDDHPTASALTLLPTSSDPREWNDEQKALLDAAGLVSRKNGQVTTAPRAIVAAFLSQCHRTRLDPVARQIYCIERAGKWTIQISIDGFRLIAERSGGYRGQTAPQWTADGVTWVDVWLDPKNPPAAARIGVHRDGFVEPVWGIATYAGYCPRDRNGNLHPTNQWSTNPSNQLLKCAEMLALRKAFPMELAGLYGTEEMDQASRTEDETPRRQVTPPASLRSIHAAGVDEHKVVESPAAKAPVRSLFKDGEHQAPPEVGPVVTVDIPNPRGVTSRDTSRDDTPMALQAKELSDGDWSSWRDAIDGVGNMNGLVQLRNEAAKVDLLDAIIPGDGRALSAYFDHRRRALTPKPEGSPAERLQAGIKRDAV